MASDDDLFVFRRFANINAQVILWMQNQIAQKETRLEAIHTYVKDLPMDSGWRNDSFEWDAAHLKERDDLMRELSALVLHYSKFGCLVSSQKLTQEVDKYVEAFSHMRSRPAADDRQIMNVRNWLNDGNGDYRAAIDAAETHSYMNPKFAPDLISISSRSRPPLGRCLESCQPLQLSKWFSATFIDGKHVKSATTTYSSDSKFEKLTNRSIIAGGLIMLLVPLWLLECFSGSKIRLSIITTFIVVFMLVMMTATINRPFEVVAASAAYAAVLMVFMQINPS